MSSSSGAFLIIHADPLPGSVATRVQACFHAGICCRVAWISLRSPWLAVVHGIQAEENSACRATLLCHRFGSVARVSMVFTIDSRNIIPDEKKMYHHPFDPCCCSTGWLCYVKVSRAKTSASSLAAKLAEATAELRASEGRQEETAAKVWKTLRHLLLFFKRT